MTKVIHGKDHGQTIELAEDPGLAEGQEVEVSVRTVPTRPIGEPGAEMRHSAGALAQDWTEDDDRILAEIHQDRKRDTRRDIPE